MQNPIKILISLIFSGNRVSLNIGQSSKFVSGRDILSSSSRSLLPRTLILHSFAARQRCLNARSGLTRILNVTSAGVRFRVTTHDCIMLNAEKCHVSRHCGVPRYFDPIIVVGSLVSQTYRNFILNNKLQIWGCRWGSNDWRLNKHRDSSGQVSFNISIWSSQSFSRST